MKDNNGKQPKNLYEYAKEKKIRLVRIIPPPKGCGRKTGGDQGGEKLYHSQNGSQMSHFATRIGQGKPLVVHERCFLNSLKTVLSGLMKRIMIQTEQQTQDMMESHESRLNRLPRWLTGFLSGGGMTGSPSGKRK